MDQGTDRCLFPDFFVLFRTHSFRKRQRMFQNNWENVTEYSQRNVSVTFQNTFLHINGAEKPHSRPIARCYAKFKNKEPKLNMFSWKNQRLLYILSMFSQHILNQHCLTIPLVFKPS